METRNRMNEFLVTLQDDTKAQFRKFEKYTLKSIDSRKAITFNNNCLREKLCPKGIIYNSI